VSQYHGIVSSAYGVYRLRAGDTNTARFIHNLVRSTPFQWELQVRSRGIWISRLQLTDEEFLRAPFPLPPTDEQAAIIRFLDWANTRIERAIQTKRKLIGLLNEQKQAIIHSAVTRGIDPTVPLKPSGISQLGDIPEHWQTPLFGRCITRIEQGWSPVAAEGELTADQWAVLTLSAVRRGVFNPLALKPISRVADIPTNIEVADGDFLLTRSNTRDRVGDVCVAKNVRPRTILCDLIYRLRLRQGAFDPQFLAYQLLSPVGRDQIERDARGSSGTMPKIAQTHINSWRVLLPPKDEQNRIVRSIETQTAPTDIAITRLKGEIDLLREYRTRLVADVATGKLDVRGVELPAITEPQTLGELTELAEVEDSEADEAELVENADA
jgi:type I restriction enzyme S subunit